MWILEWVVLRESWAAGVVGRVEGSDIEEVRYALTAEVGERISTAVRREGCGHIEKVDLPIVCKISRTDRR